jgi:outer membrane protein TolC
VQLIEARHAAALAEVTLDRLTGLDLGQPIAVTTAVEHPDAAATDLSHQPIPDLVARAKQGRLEGESLRRQADALDSSSDASRAATKPTVSASGAVEPARPNQLFVPRSDQWKTSWSAGVNVNWTLWDGGRARADAAANTAQADALRRQADDVDASIAVDVRRCLLDLDSDRAAVAAAAEAVAAASEAHRVVAERFRAGVASSTDVLDAEVTLLQASLDQTRLAAAARLDEARLLHAVGGRP